MFFQVCVLVAPGEDAASLLPEWLLEEIREKARAPERLRITRAGAIPAAQKRISEQVYEGLLRWRDWLALLDRR